jgi:hypothetical protein
VRRRRRRHCRLCWGWMGGEREGGGRGGVLKGEVEGWCDLMRLGLGHMCQVVGRS